MGSFHLNLQDLKISKQRDAADETKDNHLILNEAKRLEQIQFQRRIEQLPDSIDKMIAISEKCQDYNDSIKWAHKARSVEKSRKTAHSLSRWG